MWKPSHEDKNAFKNFFDVCNWNILIGWRYYSTLCSQEQQYGFVANTTSASKYRYGCNEGQGNIVYCYYMQLSCQDSKLE